MSSGIVNKEVLIFNAPTDFVVDLLKSVGNKIGSVHFYKRSDNSLRKMSYRLHVKNSSNPSVKYIGKSVGKKGFGRKLIDKLNNQMTVYDANKVIRGDDGCIIGRGAYRTIPLERVVRVCVNGVVYNLKNGFPDFKK